MHRYPVNLVSVTVHATELCFFLNHCFFWISKWRSLSIKYHNAFFFTENEKKAYGNSEHN